MGPFADTAGATADAALVAAARDGQQSAVAELFERYHGRIYNYAYGIAGNHDDAGDIAQDAFVRIFQSLPRLSGELNFSAYLYRTAHNAAIDTVKHRTRFVAPDMLDLQTEPALRADPERVSLLREQQEQTWRATFELSDNHREILALRELHDFSYQEIADIMGMKRATVGALLSRARLKFKETFRMSSIDTENLVKECRDMLPLLSAYIDDELDQTERVRVESHVEACAFCRLALDEMTESSRSYRALLPFLVPAAFRDSAWASVRERLISDSVPAGAPTTPPTPPAPPPSVIAPVGAPAGAFADDPAGSGDAKQKRSGAASKVVIATLVTAALVLFGVSVAGGTAALRAYQATSTTTIVVLVTTANNEQGVTGALVSDGERSTSTAATGSTVPTTAEPSTTVPPTTTPPTTRTGLSVSSTTRTMVLVDTTPPPTPALVYPDNGAIIDGGAVSLVWRAVKDPGGVLYRVEVQHYEDTGYVPTRTYNNLGATTLGRTMVAMSERWRVSAVDGQGNWSAPSRWRTMTQPLSVVVPKTVFIITTTTIKLY